MKFIRGIHNIKKSHQDCVATIGNFDGVHLGHQHLLKQLKAKSRQLNLPSLVIIFEPHPQEYFQKENSPARISLLREKLILLKKYRIDEVLCLRFNSNFSKISAQDFVFEILHKLLNVKLLIIGDDFHFGHQRLGDYHLLKKMGTELNFSVIATDTFLIDNQRACSSRVRTALSAGDLSLTEQLLGHPYSMSGRVIYGDQRGRQLGFPTANIALRRINNPLSGVFAVWVNGIDNKSLPAVANVGRRPTVDGKTQLLEIHLLDFNQNIYGKRIEVEFIEKIREEKKFASLEELKNQIREDVIAAKDIFKQ